MHTHILPCTTIVGSMMVYIYTRILYIYEYINLKKQYTYVHVCRCGQCLTGWVSCAWLHDDAATYICIYLYIYILIYLYSLYIYICMSDYIYIKQYTHRRTCVYTLYIYIELCVYMHMYTHVYLDYVQSPNTSKPHMHRSYRGGLRSGQLVVIVEVFTVTPLVSTRPYLGVFMGPAWKSKHNWI